MNYKTTQADARNLQAEIKRLRGVVCATKRRIYMLEGALVDAAQTALGFEGVLILGGWDCPASPILVCVYDDEDRCRDYCLVCGDPDERK